MKSTAFRKTISITCYAKVAYRILTFQNYMLVVCNRTMNDIDCSAQNIYNEKKERLRVSFREKKPRIF